LIRYSELPTKLRFVVLKAIFDDGLLPAMGRPSSPVEGPLGHSEYSAAAELTHVIFVGSLIQQHFVNADDDPPDGDQLCESLLACLTRTVLGKWRVWA